MKVLNNHVKGLPGGSKPGVREPRLRSEFHLSNRSS